MTKGKSKSVKPTHDLKVKDLETEDHGKVGVAWFDEENGWFSIKLSPGVSLTYESMKGKALTLFPKRTEEEWKRFHAEKKKPSDL
jgi:hypothetical protein